MFKYVTGDILKSSSDCIVNTVNCEGYMGKGIAYQFKLKFPKNNEDYKKACKEKTLVIGKLHYFNENGKTIINFPTKDKWRQKSQYEYIEAGLNALVKLIPHINIHSISIPPLGCGNGGLLWGNVKKIILEKLTPFENDYEIVLYEPSKYYKTTAKTAPKISTSHLILMLIKSQLLKFNKIRLQKTAFFMNVLSKQQYFKFDKYKYGPYAHSIDILSREIKEFQDYYKTDTSNAINIAQSILTSESVTKKMNIFYKYIDDAAELINSIQSDLEIELVSTICYIILNDNAKTEEEIYDKIIQWSKEKAGKFLKEDIHRGLNFLINRNIITHDFLGLSIK